jgi:hypothetical protein
MGFRMSPLTYNLRNDVPRGNEQRFTVKGQNDHDHDFRIGPAQWCHSRNRRPDAWPAVCCGLFRQQRVRPVGQVITPALGYANLSPHGLAKSLLGAPGLPNTDFAG